MIGGKQGALGLTLPKLILSAEPRYWVFLSQHRPKLSQLLWWQQELGSLDALFTNKSAILEQIGVPPALRNALQTPDWSKIKQQEHQLAELGGFMLTINDPDYPFLLSQINSPPLCLYGLGERALLCSRQIAIVGSRKPTLQGVESAHQFGKALSLAGVTVTSGLALGIDGMAHRGALAGSGQTIAVTGTGLDCIYPHRHRQLAEQIVEQGLIVSEFPLGTQPRPAHFPLRNRIIAGLSMGVVVIEAAAKSGSLITAYSALDENREIYALPGAVQSPVSAGCHKILQQGAKLVTSPKDVLEDWQEPVNLRSKGSDNSCSENSDSEEQPRELEISLEEDCRKVYDGVGFVRTPVEALAQLTGFSVKKLTAKLCDLELLGLVVREPGGYIKVTSHP